MWTRERDRVRLSPGCTLSTSIQDVMQSLFFAKNRSAGRKSMSVSHWDTYRSFYTYLGMVTESSQDSKRSNFTLLGAGDTDTISSC